MLLIPEQQLKLVLDYILKYFQDDYNNAVDKEDSYLFALFGGIKGKFDYYTNAVELFNRRSDHPRAIETHFFLNRERFGVPTIHITLSENSAGPNGIGYDRNFDGQQYAPKGDILNFRETGSRAFNTRFQLVFTSDNTFEVLMLYYAINAALIGNIHLLELNGIRLPSLGGADIILNDHLTPPNIYSRALMIDCFFDVVAPQFGFNRAVKDISIDGHLVDKFTNEFHKDHENWVTK